MSEISRLLVEQGRAAAEARSRSGAVWGRAIADASTAPAQIIQQQDAERRRQEQLAIQRSREGREVQQATDAHANSVAELDQMRQRQASDWAEHLIAAKVSDPAALGTEIDQKVGKLWTPAEAASIKATLTTPEHVTAFLTHLAPVRQPKVAEPFTLKTGEIRYDADNQPVAWGSDEPAKPVTFTQPITVKIGGKVVLVRPGNDGKLYDTKGERIPDAVLATIEPEKAAKAKFWVVRNGAPARVSEEEYRAGDKPLSEAGKDQDSLEQEYRTVLTRAISSRAGGLGAEDAKVLQANHLMALFEGAYDPKTGDYNIPRIQQTEIAMGLARLVSPGGVVAQKTVDDINQATLKGDLGKALTYITGTPFQGSTQDIYKMYRDSIERQGRVAQENREGSMGYLRGLAPTALEESRRKALESKTLNPLRQHREIRNTKTGERKLQVSTDGGVTWK